MVCPIAVDSSMGTAFPVWGTRAENAVKLVVALKLAASNRRSNVVSQPTKEFETDELNLGNEGANYKSRQGSEKAFDWDLRESNWNNV
eukprot:scaffold2480_cov205-Alexandrium_tamarense.AAC.8